MKGFTPWAFCIGSLIWQALIFVLGIKVGKGGMPIHIEWRGWGGAATEEEQSDEEAYGFG